MNEAESWLIEWHDRRPGVTAQCFSRGKPSSYEWLAAFAEPGDRALDLACGDGFLLELLLARGVAFAAGVDMSPGELPSGSLAARRFGEPRRGSGPGSAFADESFTLVTCHLAFMLMNPIDEVAAEVRRVLRPGGRFVAVVSGGPRLPDDAWTKAAARIAKLDFTGPKLGDRRSFTEEGLREIIRGFAEVRVEPLLVDLSCTPNEFWDLWVNSYNHEMTKPEDLGPLEEAIRADCQEILRPDGTVPCFIGLQAVCATR